MSPLLSSLDAEDFQPVGEYIDRREYHPNILDDGTAHVRLEGDLSPEALRREVVRCGTVYQLAIILDISGLQDLAFRKLKALAPHHQALEILTVVETLFEFASPDIRQYLTQHVAEQYWTIVLEETKTMVEVMRSHEDFGKGVFRILSGVVDEEEVKKEVVIKEETTTKQEKENVSSAATGEEGKEGPISASRESNASGEKTTPTTGTSSENELEMGGHTRVDNNNDKGDHSISQEEGSDGNTKDDDNKNNDKRWTFYDGKFPHLPDHESQGLTPAEAEMIKLALRQSLDEGAKYDDDQEEEDWVTLVEKQRAVESI